jgi:hypothetical protein
MNNTTYIRRKSKVYIPYGQHRGARRNKTILIATILKNMEAYGYTMSENLIEGLQISSEGYIGTFGKKIIKNLGKITGGDHIFKPMYPNFPKQVMEASAAELYVNGVLHYFGDAVGLRIMPTYDQDPRVKIIGATKLTAIALGSIEDYHEMFADIMSSKTSISESDQVDLKDYIKGDSFRLAEAMPHKEVSAFVLSELMELNTNRNGAVPIAFIKPYVNTATDVLRLATAMSDGDVSLATNSRFKSFPRKQRRVLLELLDACGDIVEDMARHQKRWIRLGERLHPSEYKYTNVNNAFQKVRAKATIEKFGTKVEAYLRSGDFVEAAQLLATRPSEFARRLDHLIRNVDDPRSIINQFKKVANKVSNPVLLQVLTHFDRRNDNSDLRVVMPKGIVAKMVALPNDLPAIPRSTCVKVTEVCREALIESYSKLEPLGNVYLDENLSNYIVPFSQRSASKAMKTIVRGSSVPLGDSSDIIRFFLWWKDGDERTDIDLSLIFFDSKWEMIEEVSYTHLRSCDMGATHSGDITSAPDGAAEFIDVDMATASKNGARYVMMSAFSYTQQPYCDLPECFAGWMMRKDGQSGEIFEPKTVKQKFDITADTKVVVPMIIDLKDNVAIWSDISLNYTPWRYYEPNNLHTNAFSLEMMGRAMSQIKKTDLYELFMLHVIGRGGQLVDNKEDADIVFSVEDGVTPFDSENIAANYI